MFVDKHGQNGPYWSYGQFEENTENYPVTGYHGLKQEHSRYKGISYLIWNGFVQQVYQVCS